MTHRRYVAIGISAFVMAALWLEPTPLVAQNMRKAWSAPRTSDGQPDLQGVWSFATATPLERPQEFAGKEFLTEAEAAEFEAREIRRQSRDLVDPAKGGAGYPSTSQGGVVPYNDFWYERGTKVVPNRRTSLIIDPPDGRRPPLTAEGERRERAFARMRAARPDSWLDLSLDDRCILGLNSGPPMAPGAYNQNVQLFQTRDYVVLLNEMVHNARVVPMDGRPHGSIRQWAGQSRGRWDRDTLVVDTRNFVGETAFQNGITSANLHLIERFTRVDEDTLLYQFTINDPSIWTKPWTAAIPMRKVSDRMYEYACHEGNYSMANMLRGARMLDKAADAPKK